MEVKWNIIVTLLILMAINVKSDKQDLDVLLEGNDNFNSKIFNEVIKKHLNKSVVFSTVSVLQPLALLGLAAIGETKDEIYKILGLPGDDMMKSAFPVLNNRLKSAKGIETNIANKVYIAREMKLKADFATIANNTFDSEIQNIDFTNSDAAAHEINKWVERQTYNTVKNFLSPGDLGPSTDIVLVNAIYFKGEWKYKFPLYRTSDSKFYTSNNESVNLPTMRNDGKFNYSESITLDAKLLELPFKGEESQFLIVLPNEIDGINLIEEKIKDQSIIENSIQHMSMTDVSIAMPRFKIDTRTELKEVLLNVGLKRIFNSVEANLVNLVEDAPNTCISNAIQKAFIDVIEKGVEAGAASAIVGVGLGSISNYKIRFEANRPFYFEVRTNGIRVFSGIMRG